MRRHENKLLHSWTLRRKDHKEHSRPDLEHAASVTPTSTCLGLASLASSDISIESRVKTIFNFLVVGKAPKYQKSIRLRNETPIVTEFVARQIVRHPERMPRLGQKSSGHLHDSAHEATRWFTDKAEETVLLWFPRLIFGPRRSFNREFLTLKPFVDKNRTLWMATPK